jgi:hypothetical protein
MTGPDRETDERRLREIRDEGTAIMTERAAALRFEDPERDSEFRELDARLAELKAEEAQIRERLDGTDS